MSKRKIIRLENAGDYLNENEWEVEPNEPPVGAFVLGEYGDDIFTYATMIEETNPEGGRDTILLYRKANTVRL
jgi:hypothetical protein